MIIVAVAALATAVEGEQHLVAGLDRGDTGPDRINYPCAFMSEHRRKLQSQRAGGDDQIGMAHAHRLDRDPHLAGLGLCDVDCFDGEWAVGLIENRCLRLHGCAPFRVGQPVGVSRNDSWACADLRHWPWRCQMADGPFPVGAWGGVIVCRSRRGRTISGPSARAHAPFPGWCWSWPPCRRCHHRRRRRGRGWQWHR